MRKEKREKQEKIKSSESAAKVRRFPKFGILDIAIILLVIAIVVGIAFRYNFFNAFASFQKLDECAVSFSVKNIENTTQYYINNGDVVYFKDSGDNFGKIMESSDASSLPLNITPSTQIFIENGQSFSVNYPKDTRIDATGRIKCEGKFSDDGTFLLNGRDYLAAGQTYVICTEKVTLEITITGIEAIE
ncbi:MAG: DUF4330 family protein [Ruminococcaceae bacterium]|nr:DUF4330 family protein [Oscillospiraceae bacterium]